MLKIYVTSDPILDQYVTNDNEFKKNQKKIKMPNWTPKMAKISNLNKFFANILLDNPNQKVILV